MIASADTGITDAWAKIVLKLQLSTGDRIVFRAVKQALSTQYNDAGSAQIDDIVASHSYPPPPTYNSLQVSLRSRVSKSPEISLAPAPLQSTKNSYRIVLFTSFANNFNLYHAGRIYTKIKICSYNSSF